MVGEVDRTAWFEFELRALLGRHPITSSLRQTWILMTLVSSSVKWETQEGMVDSQRGQEENFVLMLSSRGDLASWASLGS